MEATAMDLAWRATARQLRDAVSNYLGWQEGDLKVLEALHERYLTSDVPGGPRTSADLRSVLLADLRKCVEAHDSLAANRASPAARPSGSHGAGESAQMVTADGFPMPPLQLSSHAVELTDENRDIDTDKVRDALSGEYEVYLKEQGLDLRSADEHLFDTSLTLAQLNWVRDFTRRWDQNDWLADEQRRNMRP